MARKAEKKIILNTRRLNIALERAGFTSHRQFKTGIVEAYKDTFPSPGVSESKTNDALQGRKITERSANAIAGYLDIDLAYLTGEQPRPTRSESDKILKQRAAMINSIPLLQAADFVSRYNWHIVFDDPVAPMRFSLYDPDDTLICSDRDIKDLEAFTEAVTHLLQLGEDIAYRFLSDL